MPDQDPTPRARLQVAAGALDDAAAALETSTAKIAEEVKPHVLRAQDELSVVLAGTLDAPAAVDPVADEVGDTPTDRLVAALAAAQGEFPAIGRNHTAIVHGKEGKAGYSYSYADLGDVLAAVRPVLSAHGLALVQRTVRGDRGVVLLTELRHVSGGTLETEVDLGQSSSNPQQFGGALTYLRRYEVVTLLGIAAEEDRDAQDVEPPRNGNTAPALPAWALPATDEHKARARDVLEHVIGDRKLATQYARTLTDNVGQFPAAVAWWLGTLPQWQEAAAAAARERAAEPDRTRTKQDRAAETPDEGIDHDAREAPPAEAAAERATCGHAYRGSQTVRCVREPGHEAPHRGAGGSEWTDSMDGGGTMAPPPEEETATLKDPPTDGARNATAGTVEPGRITLPIGPLLDDVLGVEHATPELENVTLDLHPLITAGALERFLDETLDPDLGAAILELLRHKGCTCENPLARGGDDDSCPIRGHGIPF